MASTREQKSPSPENRTISSTCADISMASTASSMSIALHLAPSAGVDEFLGGLGNDGLTVVIEPVDKGPDRHILLILTDGRVVECPDQGSLTLEFLEETLVIDVKA